MPSKYNKEKDWDDETVDKWKVRIKRPTIEILPCFSGE